MRQAHEVAKVRAAEHALMATVVDGALMRRAAFGLASVCARLLGQPYGARVVVLAGSGDNGGDALYAAALLARRGARVHAVTAGSRTHEGGALALREAGGRLLGPGDDAVPALLGQADLILDGMLGIGGQGGLREPYATLATLTAQARAVRTRGAGTRGAGTRGAGTLGAGTAGAQGTGTRAVGAGAAGAQGAGTAGAQGIAAGAGSAGAREAGAGAVVVAVDLPSGIEADTGEVHGAAVRADVTVTFGTWKPGLLVDPGAGLAGLTELVDIGLAPYLDEPDLLAFQSADVAALLPVPSAESDKYRRGVLGVVAGSDRFTGAAWLAVGAAIHGGAGMVRLVSAGRPAAIVRQSWPEAVITVIEEAGPAPAQVLATAGRVQAWTAGPGMGTDGDAAALLKEVLASDVPVLVDADGLTLLAADHGLLPRKAPTLLTPHAGELARLLGADRDDVEARRLEYVRRAAAELHATVLLKGSTTVIAQPGPAQPGPAQPGASQPGPAQPGPGQPGPGQPGAGRAVHVNPTGTPWLATAGSGDVLSGLAGALLAQGLAPADAAAAAAYLHGIAARLAATGQPEQQTESQAAPIGASDVLRALPAAIRAVRAAAAGPAR
jgi:ADP-dependent NAD(P)H-hydrate dehydratase / NAD(P)H-hydrate epimerase